MVAERTQVGQTSAVLHARLGLALCPMLFCAKLQANPPACRRALQLEQQAAGAAAALEGATARCAELEVRCAQA